MKAAPFSYHRPDTKFDALQLLSTLPNARLLAGGQSLVPMLNTRYLQLDHLIDLKRVPGLTDIRLDDREAVIGALALQHDVLEHGGLGERCPIVAEALALVGHLQTRNRGTIGGSLAHMDPASELMAVAAVLDATIHVESLRGRHEIAIADYPVTYLTPKLESDEMITAVSFRLPARGHGWAFIEVAQRHGDFAIVGAAAVLEPADASGLIANARIALMGVGAGPVRLRDVETRLAGRALTGEALAASAEMACRIDAMEDAMAGAAYRQRLAGVLTRRALATAAARMTHPAGAGGGR